MEEVILMNKKLYDGIEEEFKGVVSTKSVDINTIKMIYDIIIILIPAIKKIIEMIKKDK